MLLNMVFVGFMLKTGFIARNFGFALANTGSAYFNAVMLALALQKQDTIE